MFIVTKPKCFVSFRGGHLWPKDRPFVGDTPPGETTAPRHQQKTHTAVDLRRETSSRHPSPPSRPRWPPGTALRGRPPLLPRKARSGVLPLRPTDSKCLRGLQGPWQRHSNSALTPWRRRLVPYSRWSAPTHTCRSLPNVRRKWAKKAPKIPPRRRPTTASQHQQKSREGGRCPPRYADDEASLAEATG